MVTRIVWCPSNPIHNMEQPDKVLVCDVGQWNPRSVGSIWLLLQHLTKRSDDLHCLICVCSEPHLLNLKWGIQLYTSQKDVDVIHVWRICRIDSSQHYLPLQIAKATKWGIVSERYRIKNAAEQEIGVSQIKTRDEGSIDALSCSFRQHWCLSTRCMYGSTLKHTFGLGKTSRATSWPLTG